MSEASTAWRENDTPDEAARLDELARALATMQQGLSAKLGVGRALHRKPQGILATRLDASGTGPAWKQHGVFATAQSFDVFCRLSNASALLQPDKVKDIRGFAFKILGVDGDGALGGRVTSQDFLCINQETFGVKDAGDFIHLAIAAAKGPGALLGPLWKSQGPYAARLRLVPRAPSTSTTSVPGSFENDVKTRLARADVVFDVQLQPFVDEVRTPIEDASVAWDERAAPWTTVGTLTVLRQSIDDDAARAHTAQSESGRFDPWNALAVHRPLGHIMRARKAASSASQQARGAT